MENLIRYVLKEFLTKEQKLIVRTNSSIYQIKICNIIRCESDANYTNIILVKGESILSSKTLKDYESMLLETNFRRVHQSHLVNMDFVDYLDRRYGGSLIMLNGDEVPVSKCHKKEVLDYFQLCSREANVNSFG